MQVAAEKGDEGANTDNCEISQNMGTSGAGSINLATGKMTYKFEDFVGTDSIMPINISRVYNRDWEENKYVGKHWRLNLQQEIKVNNGIYVYTDKEGKEHTFTNGNETDGGRSSVRNEKLGLDLFKDSESTIRLIDRGNNTLVFTKIASVYRLTAMHQYPSSPTKVINAYSMQITYDGNGKILTVTAGNTVEGYRPIATFNYGIDLSSIEYELGSKDKVIYYNYDDDVLTSINKTNSNVTGMYFVTTKFEEATNEFIVSNPYSLDSQHNNKSLKYEFKDGKVSKFSIGYGGSNRETSQIEYTRSNVPSSNGKDKNISSVISTTYVKHKNFVSVASFNEDGVVSQFSYELQDDNNYKILKRVISASSEGFNYNALANSYSDTLDVYHSDFGSSEDGWQGGVKNHNYKVGGINNSISGIALKKTCTFKTSNSGGETVYLSLWAYANAQFSVLVKRSGYEKNIARIFPNGFNNKWQFVAFPLGKVKNYETIAITVSSNSAVYISDVRLTKAPYETPDNISDPDYNTFGNVIKSYQYNPVDKKTYCTEYKYNSAQQLTEQIVTVGGDTKSSVEYTYNTDGLLTSRKVYDSLKQKYLEQTCGYNGYVQTSYCDENNSETKYSEGKEYTQTQSADDHLCPAVTVKNTYYGISNFLKTVSSSDCQNEMTYNLDGYLKNAKSGTEINFDYDTFGNVKAVKIGTTPLVTYNYDWKHLNSVTYANDTTVSYTYDDNDRVTKITEKIQSGTISSTITYADDEQDTVTVTNSNAVKYISKSVNKGGVTSEYSVQFPDESRVFKVQGCALNGAGRTRKVKTYFGAEGAEPFENCATVTNSNGLLTSLTRSGHGPSSSYSYDNFNRLKSKLTTYNSSPAPLFNSDIFAIEYGYNTVSGNRESTRIESETMRFDPANKKIKYDSYRYLYYKNGNLKAIYSGSVMQSNYVYDKYDRVIVEENINMGATYQYSYDKYGNITNISQYDLEEGDELESNDYTYGNGIWKDQLTSYNGQQITYDALGNPTSYRGKSMHWIGRKLVNAGGVRMEYDYNGLRLRKDDRKYYWQGNTLKAERWGNNYIYYYYDESGVSGMNYNGTEYYYRKNILGDIIGIFDTNGNRVCQYFYNAFGDYKIIGNTTIGNLNPFRYRGYYYDQELGLYYLQSRYYDPETGRFISADDVSYLNPESIFGLNLYAYCNNNPVMYSDPTGTSLLTLLLLVGIGIVAGATIGGVSAAINNENILDGIWKGAVIGGLFGLSIASIGLGVGALAGTMGGSIAVGAGVGSAFAMGISLDSQLQKGGFASLNMESVFTSWGVGFCVGGIAGAMGHAGKIIGTTIGEKFGLSLAGKYFWGKAISKVISIGFLVEACGALGGSLGGFLGGSLINDLATSSGIQNRNIPLWVASLLKKLFGT